jgi:hypothetical protein
VRETVTADDVKWLKYVRERETQGKLGRPVPTVVQSRLRAMGLIELRRGKLLVTSRGLEAIKSGP